jgi:hypothetical protein
MFILPYEHFDAIVATTNLTEVACRNTLAMASKQATLGRCEVPAQR